MLFDVVTINHHYMTDSVIMIKAASQVECGRRSVSCRKGLQVDTVSADIGHSRSCLGLGPPSDLDMNRVRLTTFTS